MSVDLFAGVPVSDFTQALVWWESLFGTEPAFFPNDHEAVWEVAEHRYVYVVEDADRCGNAVITLFVDDVGQRVADLASRGLSPMDDETYDNGVRKVTYRDDDGNWIGFGGTASG